MAKQWRPNSAAYSTHGPNSFIAKCCDVTLVTISQCYRLYLAGCVVEYVPNVCWPTLVSCVAVMAVQ